MNIDESLSFLQKKWYSKPYAALACILFAAFAQRLYVLLKLPSINSDEAMIGLMARHILAGERPFFYYGQVYYGPLDAYFNAMVFSMWGSSNLTLRILPFVCSLLFVVVIYLLGKQVYSEQVGLVSALFAAVCPAFLAVRGLQGDAAYSLVLLLGTLDLYLFQNWQEHPSRIKLAAIVAVTLLGIWVFPLMFYTVLSIAVTWFLVTDQRRNMGARRHIVPLLIGIVLAMCAAYLIIKVFGFASISFDLGNAGGLFSFTLPIFYGLILPTEDYAAFLRTIAAIPVWKVVLMTTASFVVFAAGVVNGGRKFQRNRPVLFIFITSSILVYLLFFIGVEISPTTLSYPRYLFPLYSSIPFWVDGMLDLARGKRKVQLGLVVIVLAINVANVVSIPIEKDSGQADLLAWFAKNPAVDGVYTDYWTGYGLAFESQERVIPVIISDENRLGSNRYAPYVAQSRSWRNPAYLYRAGMASEVGFQDYLARNRITYLRAQVAPYTIYYNLSRVVVCRSNGLEIAALQP